MAHDTLVLLLRSVNVGGNRMTMAWLRELAERVGARAVDSVLATGNLVVAMPSDAAALRRDLEVALAEEFGRIDVLARTPAQLASALERNPWADDVAAGRREGRFVHTMFLAERPGVDVAGLAQEHDGDQWALDGREVFVAYDGSSQGSRFQGAWLERHLDVVGTMRNHNSVRKVLAKAEGR